MEEVTVVLLPLPAQGHLNQLLHLARLLSARGLAVHYVGSDIHNRQVRDRAAQSWRPSAAAAAIRFHDFPLPPFPSPPPDPGSAVKFPVHLQPAFDAAAAHLRAPLAALLRALASVYRRVALIHDSAMAFATGISAALPGVEAFSFHSVSALAILLYLRESRGVPLEDPVAGEVNLNIITNKGCFGEEFLGFLRHQHRMTGGDSGRLLNTCRAIEGSYIDMLCEEPHWRGQRSFAIGPMNLINVLEGASEAANWCRHACLEWLDKQPAASVVYVSFGTTSSLSKEQVKELAAALEASGQRFIWVLRNADRADIYADEESSDADARGKPARKPAHEQMKPAEQGWVVPGWAPQQEILAHPSTGGFMSHCGWNSCMESLSSGVPIMAWPMHSDQPRNTVLIAHVLRTGIIVRDWAARFDLTPAAAIKDAILRLMVGEEGREVRKRARAVGEAVRAAVADGGSSKADVDAFIAYLTREDNACS